MLRDRRALSTVALLALYLHNQLDSAAETAVQVSQLEAQLEGFEDDTPVCSFFTTITCPIYKWSQPNAAIRRFNSEPETPPLDEHGSTSSRANLIKSIIDVGKKKDEIRRGETSDER